MRSCRWRIGVCLALLAGPGLANDFPTLERVDHVLTCMKRHGGQTLDNLYACSCEIDAIAASMRHDEFEEASTFRSLRNMPGERGSAFRESKRGRALMGRLEQAEQSAEKTCFLQQVARPNRP
ncbi:MAG: hypothetical protein ACREWG_12260 [Gammaproteobacteria bacterium]